MPQSLTLIKNTLFWDEFVSNSPQGNIFCRTDFLNAFDMEYDLWLLEEKGIPQIGAVILHKDKVPLKTPLPFTLYQGILFAGSNNTLPPHRRAKWTIEITNALLEGLSDKYDRLVFCLHHEFYDLRALQWFNYHEPHLGQFKIDLNYTGILDVSAYPDFETYLMDIRNVRRYEYRKAIREGLRVEVSKDIDTLNRLHKLTFERQGLKRIQSAERYLRSITHAAITHDFGEMLLCRNSDGEGISATLFLYDNNCCYYLFGANHPEFRNTNGGTFLLLENVRRCKNRNFKWVDMVGINSPNRGDFKTSFNAFPKPYFLATWEKP